MLETLTHSRYSIRKAGNCSSPFLLTKSQQPVLGVEIVEHRASEKQRLEHGELFMLRVIFLFRLTYALEFASCMD